MKKNINLPFETEEYLASIIETSEDAIIGMDLKSNILSWNPAAERIFGYTAEEAQGKNISFIVLAEELYKEDEIKNLIKQNKRSEHFETLRRSKNGRLINISTTISPIKDKVGKIVGYSQIARDITNVRKAERASAYLAAIIESSDDAIISKDLSGYITSWNKSAERIFGYTAEEVIGRHITIIIPTERLSEEDNILKTLKSGKRVDHFETVRRHKDGHLVNVSLTVSPIRDSSNKIVGASKVSRNISDKLRAEKELNETIKKKDEFIANMSHELRTPMNAVIGVANILKRMDEIPEKAKKYIDTLKNSADNMIDLINDLLDFAKIESNTLEIENIEFNLIEAIKKIINLSEIRAQEKKINLYINYSPDLSQNYIGDPLRVSQILTNLITNSIKFTNEGFIQLDVFTEGSEEEETSHVTFKISDTGIGIEKSKLELVFEKFTQADSSITRKYGGSGLGLAIVKSYVEKMRGSIKVESEEGVGTTFFVTLPLKKAGDINFSEEDKINNSSHRLRNKKNILLVEDYEPNIIVAGALLEDAGYNYDIARNGYEAIRKFSQNRYDVILMDIQMHELDGLEATFRIRKMEIEKKLGYTPIVAITAHVKDQDKTKCYNAGMDDFIPKPFDPQILQQKIEKYISIKI